MKITAKAPTRIDLCGGTLDIWPLSVMFAPAISVNAATSLYATVTASKSGKKGTVIHAPHPGTVIAYDPATPEKKKTLFHRALDFIPAEGWHFEADCLSPAGAGLGGSSSLLIAFLKTLAKINSLKMADGDLLDAAKNIEARHLGIPTGVQDYVAALSGGVNGVLNLHEKQTYERLDVPAAELERRVVLVYSGQSRVSGVPNWLMLKKAVEHDAVTRAAFTAIAKNSLELSAMLLEGLYDRVGKLIDVESAMREKLGKGIITPKLRRAFAIAKKNGGHPKVCGAGGGGCFIVWCAPEKKPVIAAAMAKTGMRVLDFTVGAPQLKVIRGG